MHAGTTFEATVSSSLYPASDGWAAQIVAVKGQARFEVNGTASGDDYAFEAAATITAEWSPGEYQLFVFALLDETKKLLCGPTPFRLWPDPSAATLTVSDLYTELEAVNEAIAGVLAGKGVQSYSFQTEAGSRSAQRMSLQELRQHKAWVEDRLEAELAQQGGRKARRGWRKIKTNFENR